MGSQLSQNTLLQMREMAFIQQNGQDEIGKLTPRLLKGAKLCFTIDV